MTATLPTAQTAAPDDDPRDLFVTRRLAAIDGLRGVSIIAVIVFHLGARWLRGGFLGVDLFFVISGFVITRLLIVEQATTGRIGLRRFWERRARRLLPSLLVVLGAVAVATLVDPSVVDRTVRRQGFAALFYVSNWFNVFAHVGYWDARLESSPLNHLWSLAIEEQFYLVWPLVVVGVARRAGARWRSALVKVTAGLALVSAAAQVVLARTSGIDRAYFGTDTRAVAILLGALVALVSVRVTGSRVDARLGTADRSTLVHRRLSVGGYVAVLYLLVQWITADSTRPGLYRGQLVLTSLAGAVLVALVVVIPGAPIARALAWPPLVAIGLRSYVLYLWHFPVFVVLDGDATGLHGVALVAVRLVVTAALAEATHRLVEDRLRRRRRLQGRRLVILLGVPTVIVAGLLGQVQDHPAPSADGTALVGAPVPGGRRVMIVGDSWAHNTGLGLARVSKGTAQIVNLGRGSCGIADPSAYLVAGPNGAPQTLEPVCHDVIARWREAVATDRPDAVVLQVGNWDQAQAMIDGAWRTSCDPVFDRRYARKLDEALSAISSTRAAVYMFDVVDSPGSARGRSDCMNHLLHAAAERHPEVHLLRLGDRLCPRHTTCPRRLDGATVYDETDHLAAGWSDRVARWVLEEIDRTVPARRRSPRGLLLTTLPTADEATVALGGTSRPEPMAEPAGRAVQLAGRPVDEDQIDGSVGVSSTSAAGRIDAVSLSTTVDTQADAIASGAIFRARDRGFGRVEVSDPLTVVMVKRNGVKAESEAVITVRRVDHVVVVRLRSRSLSSDAALIGLASTWSDRLESVRPTG